MNTITNNNNTKLFLQQIKWNTDGLITVIAQEKNSKDILMLAWMNEEALLKTIQIGQAVYWSRSRQKLWHKGEESGHYQQIHSINLDCDGDAILITVTQECGIACHTGRHSCFFYTLEKNKDNEMIWKINQDIITKL